MARNAVAYAHRRAGEHERADTGTSQEDSDGIYGTCDDQE